MTSEEFFFEEWDKMSKYGSGDIIRSDSDKTLFCDPYPGDPLIFPHPEDIKIPARSPMILTREPVELPKSVSWPGSRILCFQVVTERGLGWVRAVFFDSGFELSTKGFFERIH